VVVAQPLAPVATTTTESTGSTESTESTGTTTPTAPVAPPAPSLYQVPLTLNVTGSYFELEQFINKLEGLKRSFLVSGFTLAPATGGAASATGTEAGGPAPGDLTLALTGRVYLAPATAAPAAVQPTTAATTAPAQ